MTITKLIFKTAGKDALIEAIKSLCIESEDITVEVEYGRDVLCTDGKTFPVRISPNGTATLTIKINGGAQCREIKKC